MNCFDDVRSVFRRNPNAVACVYGSEKYPSLSGTVMFYQLCGKTAVCAEITGLPTDTSDCAGPIFAFHIHDGGECTGNASDYFADSGMHYNPHNCPHPYHAGDLPPLFAVGDTAFSLFTTDRFTVSEILGKAVIIHDSPDDFTSQPSGGAGEKIACGIIRPVCR
ncbi:MAG: superoxide dismutase family protein [Butyrivibrio sp.]|nr:superoxide dismutase family protein [Butyrivibrio sp.]